VRPEANEPTMERMSVVRHTLGLIKALRIEKEIIFNLEAPKGWVDTQKK
jgi:hypothetical protein